jgi:hypothetical protein
MNAVEAEWVKWLTNPSVLKSTLFVRVDLSLKQRRESELKTRRPAARPRVQPSKRRREFKFVPAVDAVVPVTSRRIERLDYDGTLECPGVVNVHVKALGRRPISLHRAALLATDYYLSLEEVRTLAVRVANRLNVDFYRGKARRMNNPLKLPALICLHDKRTRFHLPMLFGLPAGVTLADFQQALRHILAREPFVFAGAVDDERACKIEIVQNLAASVLYNANDRKSLMKSSVLYVYTPPSIQTGETTE